MKEDQEIVICALSVFSERNFCFEVISMNKQKITTRELTTLAMLTAIAYALVCTVRIPIVLFLKYEPKDVIITIGGFLLGPMASFVISLVVSLLEMVTVSDTGPIGALMNLLSTCAFACTASLVYKKCHKLKGAILGLAAGSGFMVCAMLLWNWLITPLYMGVSREQVAGMLIPVFLPFNALKAGFNSALVLGLYKPLTAALRRTRLLPETNAPKGGPKPGLYLFALGLLATCVVLLLVLKGIL